jgi:hypothetical protein
MLMMLWQAAVSARGGLVGRSVRDLQLRQKYKAALVSFHREVRVRPTRLCVTWVKE